MDGSELFLVEVDGQPCAAFSLRISGRTVWVVQAGGSAPGADLIAETLPVIEQMARGVNAASLAFSTQRPGLVRKMARRGYEVTGVTLRKSMQ